MVTPSGVGGKYWETAAPTSIAINGKYIVGIFTDIETEVHQFQTKGRGKKDVIYVHFKRRLSLRLP
jgi:hypothetical protein